jgi:hypothetical protein
LIVDGKDEPAAAAASTGVLLVLEKVQITPTYGGWITSPPTYETGCFTPELFKTGQIPLR